MLIPLGTDAPVYHWPCATVGMMAVCMLATVAAWVLGPDQTEPWMLAYGARLHPIQWLTYSFLHLDLLHLSGNLLYLWIFGLVVGWAGWRSWRSTSDWASRRGRSCRC